MKIWQVLYLKFHNFLQSPLPPHFPFGTQKRSCSWTTMTSTKSKTKIWCRVLGNKIPCRDRELQESGYDVSAITWLILPLLLWPRPVPSKVQLPVPGTLITQAYTSKRRILIQVLPVPNAYTKSTNECIHYANPFVICSCIYVFCLRIAIRHSMRIPGIRIEVKSNCNKDAYMHEQTRKGFGKMNICITRFGIRIGDRKYLNEYTPFGSVSMWLHLVTNFLTQIHTVVHGYMYTTNLTECKESLTSCSSFLGTFVGHKDVFSRDLYWKGKICLVCWGIVYTKHNSARNPESVKCP